MVYLLTKLVNLGVFPAAPPTSRSQPSFFGATLVTIHRRLRSEGHETYSSFWSNVLKSISSTLTLQTIITSLLSSFPDVSPPLSPDMRQRSQAKQGGTLLRQLIGPLSPENDELWQCFIALALGRDWSEGRARMFVCWVAQVGDPTSNEKGDNTFGISHHRYLSTSLAALEKFLDKAVELWSNPEHVKHSLLSRHHCEFSPYRILAYLKGHTRHDVLDPPHFGLFSAKHSSVSFPRLFTAFYFRCRSLHRPS
jgi:telomere length regulation protein